MFYGVDEFADDITQGFRKGKYSPLETADRLDLLADTAKMYLSQAILETKNGQSPSFRRLAIDVEAQIELGRFFANKFRAALAYALYERSGGPTQLGKALELYNMAADRWRQLAAITKNVYKPDMAFGNVPNMRGHWSDRLPEIERDIAAMEGKLHETNSKQVLSEKLNAAAKFLKGNRICVDCSHQPPQFFHKGAALELQISIPNPPIGINVDLHYRHANQAELYNTVEMSLQDGVFSASVPADYTESPYALIYFFELRDREGDAWIFPGLDDTLSNQPYFMVFRQ